MQPLRYAGFGIQLAATIVLAVLGGQWLDRKAGTGGLLTVTCALLGFGAALYWLIRQLKSNGSR